MIESDKIQLTGSIDADCARQARNDYRVRKWCRQFTLISPEEQKTWCNKIETDAKIKMFGIHDAMGMGQLGVCGFTSIDRQNRSAEFSLYIDANYWHHGYGRSALKLLLDHGFKDFGFHRIFGEVFENNPALEKLFIPIGFKIVGRNRDSYFRDGKFIDSVNIDMLENDWSS